MKTAKREDWSSEGRDHLEVIIEQQALSANRQSHCTAGGEGGPDWRKTKDAPLPSNVDPYCVAD